MYPLVVNEDGSIEHIVSDENDSLKLGEQGERRTRRASHVVPLDPVKRTCFVLLRKIFGDRGRVSDWTRSWSGPWVVFIIGEGVTLGPFRTRQQALDREVHWLLRRRFAEKL